MACGNNNNRGGNLGGLKNILDFNVTYTGCETSCGGREIKTGDSLRNVLDALVANCDGGSGPIGSSTNFWFSRNNPTFTVDVKENDFALTGSGAIYEFVDGEWQDTGIRIGGGSGGGGTWGSITGSIADQTDLTEYINLLITESPLSLDKFGENFHEKEGDEKIHLGRGLPYIDEIGADYLVLATDEVDPLNPTAEDPAHLSLISAEGESHVYLASKSTMSLNSGQDFSLISKRLSILATSPLSPNDLTDITLSSGNAHVMVAKNIGSTQGRAEIRASGGVSRVAALPDGETRVAGSGGTIEITSSGIELFKSDGSTKTAPIVTYGSTNAITLTDDRQLTHKKYVDDLIAAQAATIADLTARIEALENA